MKNKTKLPGIFLGIVLVVMYLPILMVVLYSFNEGKPIASWKGFSLDWYVKLFQDEEIWEAVKNSLILGVLSCFAAAVLGTVGAVGMAKVKSRTKGPMEYISTLPIMIPDDHPWNGVSDLFPSAEPSQWNGDAGDCAYLHFVSRISI